MIAWVALAVALVDLAVLGVLAVVAVKVSRAVKPYLTIFAPAKPAPRTIPETGMTPLTRLGEAWRDSHAKP